MTRIPKKSRVQNEVESIDPVNKRLIPYTRNIYNQASLHQFKHVNMSLVSIYDFTNEFGIFFADTKLKFCDPTLQII